MSLKSHFYFCLMFHNTERNNEDLLQIPLLDQHYVMEKYKENMF